MSDYIAEARVLIQPDTRLFRTELQSQLAAIKIAPITIPVVAAGAGLATAAAATATLSAQQAITQKTTLGLASAAEVENSAFGRQAVILNATTASTQAAAVNQEALRRSANKTTGSLLGLGSASGKLDAALLGLRTAVGSTAVIGLGAGALAAIALGKALRSLIGSTAQLEQQLNTFQATTGATAREMEAVSEAATQLGADITIPGVSANDAAIAMSELAKAGLSVEESIAAARGVLQLATAASIDFVAATELAASALNSFGLSGEEAVHVADLLAGASIAAQGSISDMGFALSQSSAVARQAGLTLEATTTFLALLAKNGLKGSDAGTSLRTALLRLINPSSKAKKEIEDLGISIRDMAGNVRVDIFSQFAAATRNLSAAQRDAILATVFGQDAIRAAAILAREGVEGFADTEKIVLKQGAAAELASAKSKGLAGAWENLKNQAQTLGNAIGKDLNPLLEAGVSGMGDIIGAANKASEALSNLGGKAPPETVKEITTQLANLQGWLDQAASEGNTNRVSRLRVQIAELAAELRKRMNPALFENADASDRAAASTRILSDAHERMADSARQATDAIKGLNDAQITGQLQAQKTAVSRAQAYGGTGLEELRAERDRIDRLVTDAQRRGTKGPNLQRLFDERRRVNSEIEAILNSQRAESERVAREAQDAAKRAQESRDKQFQALAAMFEGGQQRIEDAIARAGIRGNLAKELSLNKALIQFLRNERKALLERLKVLKVSASVRKQILNAIARAIEDAQQEVIQLRQQQADALKAAAAQKLDLKIQFFQIKGNIAGEIKARRAKLAVITAELIKLKNAGKKYTAAWWELKVQQAEEQKAIQELTGQTKEKNKAQASLMFAFLQAQQGFAANLLGNLIPGGATAGLVGNTNASTAIFSTAGLEALRQTTAATSAEELIRQERAGILPQEHGRGRFGIAGDASKQAQISAGAGLTVTRGQGSTQIELLRKILRTLQNMQRGQGFPEARYESTRSGAALDMGHGGGGSMATA